MANKHCEMKIKVLFLILFIGAAIPATLKAQYGIPNGSFELWASANKPADWTVAQGKPTQAHLFAYSVLDSALSTDSTTDSMRVTVYAKDGSSLILMHMFDSASPAIISQKFAITARPRYFSMNYAYLPETYQN